MARIVMDAMIASKARIARIACESRIARIVIDATIASEASTLKKIVKLV